MSALTLPSSWRIGCLGDVAAKVPNAIVDGPFGSNLKLSDYVSSGVPVLQGKNITNDRFRWFDVRFISAKKAEELKRSSVRVGDLLMVKIGSIGYSAIVDSLAGYDFAVIPANLAKITPNLNLVDREYLHHWLTSPETKRYLLANASKTAQPALSLGKIKALPIPIPPMEEQRRIAAILDQAETLRTQRRQALAQLDSLTQSLFLDMFGDPVMNPKGLPVVKFGDVGTLDRGISKHRPRNAPELLGGNHPLVQTGEVSNCDGYIRSYTHTYSDLGLRQSKMWPAGTLCITIAANIAKTGILTFDACFPDSVVGFRAEDSATVEYVRVWLSFLQKALEDSAPESAQKNINLAILRGLNIPLPPLALQQTFATRIQAIEALKATHRVALAQLDALFASLQQQAFSGELTRSAAAVATHTKPDLSAMCMLDAKKMLEALIYVTNRMPEHNFYKSLKALYTGDRQHLENHGCLIYGETYEAMEHGPVPKAAYALTKTLEEAASSNLFADDPISIPLRRTENQLIPARDADFDVLSAAERKSLDWAIKYYAPMNFGDTKTASHDSAYLATALNAPIAIEDIIRTLPVVAQRRFFG